MLHREVACADVLDAHDHSLRSLLCAADADRVHPYLDVDFVLDRYELRQWLLDAEFLTLVR